MHLLAFTLPASVGPDELRQVLIVTGLGCIVLAVLAVRFVAKLYLRASLAAALVVLGFVLFVERAELASCARTCSCEVLNVGVQVPACRPQRET